MIPYRTKQKMTIKKKLLELFTKGIYGTFEVF